MTSNRNMGIQNLKNGLLALFLKSNCPLCDRPADAEVCQYCERQLRGCQSSNSDQRWQGDLPVFVWGTYGGVLKRAIATLKYDNQPQLARLLGHWLGQAWLNSPAAKNIKKLTVVPIPLHITKQQQRGYNQAELIARSFCEVTGYNQQALALERVRATEAQFTLSPQERKQNVADAFIIDKNSHKFSSASPILLVDDIYTTGATVRSAAQTLQERGLSVYGVAAIASSSK